MAEIRVESERTIDAQQAALFKLVADYEGARPRYLPPNFEDWRVVQGGLGGGTVATYLLRAGKRERTCRIEVEEETVGSVLVERDANSSLVTTWTLRPDGNAWRHGSSSGDRTHVRIASSWRGAGGVRGLFERRFAPPGLRRIQDDLLDRLARYAAEVIPPQAPAPPQQATDQVEAVELPSGEFPDDLREPVGPAARRAQAGRGDGESAREG
jgi:Polyketide cyclase / dehydrase and lipid transport